MTRRLTPSDPAFRRFREFHGRRPAFAYHADFYIPSKLIFLGRAIAIIYEIDKKNGGGDGTVAEYIHDFETPVGLFMDERGKRQLYLIGEKLKVTKDGVEN